MLLVILMSKKKDLMEIPQSASFAKHRVNCKICKHPDAEIINKKHADGVMVKTIVDEYKLNRRSTFQHFKMLAKEQGVILEQKRVSIRDFCERVIRTCEKNLLVPGSKVYVRDALAAAALLSRIGESEAVDEIWKAIEKNEGKNLAKVTGEIRITKTANIVG